MANYPKYDNDTATKGYVDNLLKNQGEETTEKISTIPKSYSAPPSPPYYKDSLLAYENKIYKCINDKVIGEFSWNDWAVVATDDTSLNSFISDTYGPEMDLKANDADLTGAELIIRINADTTQALLKASKINLTANDIINLIAGNSINLTSKNITINSTNFNVDKNGNVTANSLSSNNATITGGDITLKGDQNNSKMKIIMNSDSTIYSEFYPNWLRMMKNGVVGIHLSYILSVPALQLYDGTNTTQVRSDQISTPKINAGNIDYGSCVLDSGSSDVRVFFNKTFASAPKVFLTPYTSKTGVIAAKVKNITTTYFDATIGGNIGQFTNVNYSWFAIG